MAQARRLQAFIETVPADQREAAQRILGRIPPAQQPLAIQIIQQVIQRSGTGATDALRHLEGIVSSDNFRPHHLTTVSLLVRRAGPNTPQALRELGQIIDHEKFNRFVLMTVNLSLTRAGEDSHEALRALRFLLSNPNFTQRSLNIALPEMFVRYLDTAIRSAGDAGYLGIRVLGDLLANPNFGPQDFTARFARTFGTMVRTVREECAPNHFYGLESLGALIGNGSIRPQDTTPATASALSRALQQAIEYTRAVHGSDAGPGSAIDNTMRTLNLILGHRAFRPDMLLENGILERTIAASTADESQALSQFLNLMRGSRQHPQALSVFGSLVSSGSDPVIALFALNALLSNPNLAPMLGQEGFVERFRALISIGSANIAQLFRPSGLSETNVSNAIGRALRMFDPNRYVSELPPRLRESPAAGLIAVLLSDQRISPEMLERVMDTMQRLGPNADIAALCLAQLVNNTAFRPQMLSEGFLSDLAALAGQAAASPFDFRILSGILMSRNFRSSLIAPDGLIPQIIRERTTESEEILRTLSGVMQDRALTPGLEAVFRESVSVRGNYGRLALNALGVILQNSHITPNTYPALLQIVRSMGEYSDAALNLYNSLFSNPSLRPMLTDPAFITRLCGLMRRVAEGSDRGRDAISALSQMMRHPSFRPEMMPRIDRIQELAGRSSRFVFGYLQHLQTIEGVAFSRVMEPGFLDMLCRMGSFITSHGGRDPSEAHSAFSSLLGDLGADVFALLDKEDDVFAYLEAAARSAGNRSPIALRAIIPRVHLIDLDEDDAATLGAWIRRYMDGLPDEAQREAAIPGVANMMTAVSRNSDLYDILFDDPESYGRGRTLAESLIPGRPISPDVILNFAYGIDRIGEARVRALHQRFGIRHFARYSDDMLVQLYRNRDRSADPSRPTVFVSFPHWDHNGAFYDEGRRLDDLLGSHNVIIFESGNEREFYQAAYDFRMRYGRSRDIIIAGHGSPHSIRLGSEMEEGLLDMTDADELRVLRDVLGPEPRVILVSCSTGRDAMAIGGLISRVVGATLMAPRDPSGVRSYDVDSQGRITAEFRNERGFFFEGVDLSAGR